MTATGTYAPFAEHQFFIEGGTAAAAGYRLFTYTAGTSTKVSTYTDVALSVANANPLTLGANGRATLMLQPGLSYKFVLAPSGSDDPPLSPTWTRDNIGAVPAGATAQNTEINGTAGESLTANDSVCLSDGSGGGTSGRWYKTDADFTYLSNLAEATGFAAANISTGATGTIRRGGQMTGLSGLTPGSVYYASATAGAITATPPTNARIVGQAETATVLTILPGPADATATIPGLLGTGAQTKTGVMTFASLPLGATGFARQTADLVKNANVTFADAVGLTFNALANESYSFRFVMRHSSATAADIKFRINGPAAPTSVWYGILTSQAAVIAGSETSTAFAGELLLNTNAIGNIGISIVTGLLRNGVNAGAIQMQMTQVASVASDTTLYADSFVVYERVA